MKKFFSGRGSRASAGDRNSEIDPGTALPPFAPGGPNDNPFMSSGNTPPGSPRTSSVAAASPRNSLTDIVPKQRTSLRELFSGNPDTNHDKKVSSLPIDPRVTAAKASLRKLRDAVDATAAFYTKYAERKKGAQTGHLPLLLPEMAEWSRHEAFCGASATSALLYRASSQLNSIEQLTATAREAIGGVVATRLKDEAKALVERGLEAVLAFELSVRDATAAKDAGTKALKKATAARESALSDERKAATLKDEKKRPAAAAAAARALEKANMDIADADASIDRADTELTRLTTDAQPAALATAAGARSEAEAGPLLSAASELCAAYDAFAKGATNVAAGLQPLPEYNPTAKRKAPKETSARFAAYVVQWTLAKRRAKAAVALLDEFAKAGLNTLLAPAREGAVIDALCAEMTDAAAQAALRAVPLSEATHSQACDACRAGVTTLVSCLAEVRILLKQRVQSAEDYEKRLKALKALNAKRDDTERDVSKLSALVEGGTVDKARVTLEKKRSELQKLTDEVALKAAALETSSAELEAFAAALAADDGDNSVYGLVASPLASCVDVYIAFCATRAGGVMPTSDGGGGGGLGGGASAAAAPAMAPPSYSENYSGFGGGGGGAASANAADDWSDDDDAGVQTALPFDVGDNPFLAPRAGGGGGAAAAAAATAVGGGGSAPVDVSAGENPFMSAPSVAPAAPPGGSPVAGSAPPSEAGLPAGWYTAVDPGSGDTYYVSPSGEASWERPTAASDNPFLGNSAANPF